MNKPMPAASTARPRDAPLVPLSRGSAGEKEGGGKAREGRKREGAMEGERQTGRKGKDEGIPSLVTTLQRAQGSLLPSPFQLQEPPLGCRASQASGITQGGPHLTAGCRPHTTLGSRMSLSSQPLGAGPSRVKEGAVWAPLLVPCMAGPLWFGV